MSRTVERIQFTPQMPKARRVAAYARVSSGKDAMLHSLAAQVVCHAVSVDIERFPRALILCSYRVHASSMSGKKAEKAIFSIGCKVK